MRVGFGSAFGDASACELRRDRQIGRVFGELSS
jgi:hypothetical protein